MRGQRLWRIPIRAAAALAALTLTACDATQPTASGGDDKAGGDADPVVLTMADATAFGSWYNPAVQHFVDQVAALSDGALRIDVSSQWGNFAPDVEQQIVRDVAAGEADLAWIWTRALDTVGVDAFRALNAPMLIDSYPLQQAVIASDIPGEMLPALDSVGVTGLAVLADGLLKPIAVDHPLLSPADYEGITFTTRRSTVFADTVHALEADTEVAIHTARTAGLQSGEIQGYEMGLRAYSIGDTFLSPYATANVNLWANPAVLIANPHTLAELTATQRDWVTQAAASAAEQSTDLVNHDAELLIELCRGGARFADASEADLAAMRQAVEPVYAMLERDAQTAEFIARIEALKETTEPGPALDIPADCTGPSPLAAPAATSEVEATSDQSTLNGTYRWTITKDDALAHGAPSDQTPEALASFPVIVTVTLNDGIWTMRSQNAESEHVDCDSEDDCTYTIHGDRIAFDWADEGYVLEWTFTADENGSLQLEPAGGQIGGDEFVWATKQWERIDGGAVQAPAGATSLNGTYRWTLTEEDASTDRDASAGVADSFPVIFTVTLDDGVWTMRGQNDSEEWVDCDSDDDCTYTVDGDTLTFIDEEGRMGFTFTSDEDGNLQLQPAGQLPPGVVFVMTTKPWERIGGDGAEEAPESASLNGTYRWTLTKDDALAQASGVPGIMRQIEAFPCVFTVTLNDDRWTMTNRCGDGESSECDNLDCTYTIDGDLIRFDWSDGGRLEFTFAADDDGLLHLQPVGPMAPDHVFVWTTKPWERID